VRHRDLLWFTRVSVSDKKDRKRDPKERRPLSDPDNPIYNADNLERAYIKSLENLPAAARKRFFEGIYVDEVEGAPWSYEHIAAACSRGCSFRQNNRNAPPPFNFHQWRCLTGTNADASTPAAKDCCLKIVAPHGHLTKWAASSYRENALAE
jgi:hypothetical protein